MKKAVYICVILGILNSIKVYGSDWKLSGLLGVSYNETSISDNWSGGETDARNWIIKGEGSAEKDAEKINWLNILKLEYGKASIAESAEAENADLVDFDTIFSYKLNKYSHPYLAFMVDTQFTEFFNPAVLGESAGIGLIIYKNDMQNLKTRVGFALRQTIYKNLDDEIDTGAEWITNYALILNQNIKLVSEVKIFTAFDAGADLRWDNGLYIKLSKYLTSQIAYLVIHNYDPEAPRPELPDDIQTRLTFTLGISHNLFD